MDFIFCINNYFIFLVSDAGFKKFKDSFMVWVLIQDYVVTDVY